jgi:hypothetical protein
MMEVKVLGVCSRRESESIDWDARVLFSYWVGVRAELERSDPVSDSGNEWPRVICKTI